MQQYVDEFNNTALYVQIFPKGERIFSRSYEQTPGPGRYYATSNFAYAEILLKRNSESIVLIHDNVRMCKEGLSKGFILTKELFDFYSFQIEQFRLGINNNFECPVDLYDFISYCVSNKKFKIEKLTLSEGMDLLVKNNTTFKFIEKNGEIVATATLNDKTIIQMVMVDKDQYPYYVTKYNPNGSFEIFKERFKELFPSKYHKKVLSLDISLQLQSVSSGASVKIFFEDPSVEPETIFINMPDNKLDSLKDVIHTAMKKTFSKK